MPDVLLGVSGAATWPAIIGLMVMHVAVAAIPVITRARLLPLPRTNG